MDFEVALYTIAQIIFGKIQQRKRQNENANS